MLYVDEQERRDSQLSAAAARVAELETAARHSERLLATFEEENVKLDSRRIEGRQLLRRMVKYVREDRAVTPGKTRLERLTSQVADYLNRTHEPRDILRAEQAKK